MCKGPVAEEIIQSFFHYFCSSLLVLPPLKYSVTQLNGVYVLQYGHRFWGFNIRRGFQNGDESHAVQHPERFQGLCDQARKKLPVLCEISGCSNSRWADWCWKSHQMARESRNNGVLYITEALEIVINFVWLLNEFPSALLHLHQ